MANGEIELSVANARKRVTEIRVRIAQQADRLSVPPHVLQRLAEDHVFTRLMHDLQGQESIIRSFGDEVDRHD